MQMKDPMPEIRRLEELALLVKSGEIKLPRFQRPFVWKEHDMLKLLDSLYKGYPIGSLLIWNSSQKLNSERSISGLKVGIEENNYYPTSYLLDGQQRLTTLCGALFWDGNDESSIWNIHFDLEKEVFVHPRRSDLTTLFPLNRIINTRDFIRQCMKFDHHEKRDIFLNNAERLLKAIKDYKIAVVKIGDMTIEEVAPIFERINSTGRKLTIVDLMMAATWSNGFDLTTKILSIKHKCSLQGFDDLTDQFILRTISASAELGINKDDIQRLREKKAGELTYAADQAEICLLKAIYFVKSEIGILNFSYVPYGFQLTYLAEFFRLKPSASAEEIAHLKAWFWFTSATRYFGTTNTGQVSKDIANIRAYATGRIPALFENRDIDISQLLYDKFNLRNATSTTFALLLNSESPNKTLTGRPIDVSHQTLKSSKFFGIFAPQDASFRNLNVCRVIDPYQDSDSKFYSLSDLHELDSHLLNDACATAKLEHNESEFIRSRSDLLANKVSNLTGCHARFTVTEECDLEPQVFEDE